MKYILIAGIDGAGKTSLIGILKGLELISDDVYDDRNDNSKEISYCLENNLTFTQETTLAGHRIEKTIRQARKQGYDIVMFYVGLNSVEESVLRIANRVRKGGHDIPEEYVRLRYQNRIESLNQKQYLQLYKRIQTGLDSGGRTNSLRNSDHIPDHNAVRSTWKQRR